MHCIRKVAQNLLWVGANDRRLAMFEGVYSVPDGISYNSYLLLDEKTVLFDTVDKAVENIFFENVKEGLGGRKLDYLILQHIEPDHSAAVKDLISQYPDVTLVLNEKSAKFLYQFYGIDGDVKKLIVKEGDSLCTGRHNLSFYMAPMVHWPEVMVTYDATSRTLFSADAFGTFGALNGALFADEVDFNRDYLDETRRYYTNIVGKYGAQTMALINKSAGLKIETICPLHGFVWRKNLHEIIEPHIKWAQYQPEEQGVMIAYASIYGNTANAADILACRLREAGIKTVVYDVSVTPASDIVSAAFKWSHLVFASPTYNMGIFVTMEALIYDLVAHNIQNRTVALIENGSWALASGKLMRAKLETCRDMTFIEGMSMLSSLDNDKLTELYRLADEIAATFPSNTALPKEITPGINQEALRGIPYGLFLLAAKEGDKDNACIINTAAQVTDTPLQITFSVNKANLTHDMILKTKQFALSVLTEGTPFEVFKHFGMASGKDKDKFAIDADSLSADCLQRLENGVYALAKHVNAIFAGEVVSTTDCGSHTIFVASVTQAAKIGDENSCTYNHYFNNIKPKTAVKGKGYVCKVCGWMYEGDVLPDDIICPLCKHGAADFEKI